jgi:hypothetical protein
MCAPYGIGIKHINKLTFPASFQSLDIKFNKVIHSLCEFSHSSTCQKKVERFIWELRSNILAIYHRILERISSHSEACRRRQEDCAHLDQHSLTNAKNVSDCQAKWTVRKKNSSAHAKNGIIPANTQRRFLQEPGLGCGLHLSVSFISCKGMTYKRKDTVSRKTIFPKYHPAKANVPTASSAR